MTVENTVSVDNLADSATAAAEETHGVELTDAAAIKARTLLEQEGRDDMHLRIAVQPGATSCSSTTASSTATCSATSTACASAWTG
jgi:hypothetical protein